jgi:type III secretion protein L
VGLVFLIDRPGYRLATDRKVLKRNEATVMEQITQAYVRAQDEINTALANVDNACTKATDEAYRKGLVKAEREATQRWTLAEVERRALLQAMQPALAEMIVEAVSLLAKEIDRKAFMARALELFQGSLRTTTWANLRVPPEAVAIAEAALNDFDRQTGLGKFARVVADESLPEDGCVLESELGTIDASLGTQLQAIRGAITDAVRLIAAAGAD